MPWEALPPLSLPQLDACATRVREAYGPRYDESLMPVFLAGAAGVPEPHDWVDQKVTGRRAIDAMFGVRMLETRAHEVWGGPFLAQMLLDAERFAACYNEALGEYRRQMRIKGTQHPIPDLVRKGDRLELPIWAIQPNQPRKRVFCRRQGDRIELFAENDPIGTLAAGDLRRWQTAEPALAQCDLRGPASSRPDADDLGEAVPGGPVHPRHRRGEVRPHHATFSSAGITRSSRRGSAASRRRCGWTCRPTR